MLQWVAVAFEIAQSIGQGLSNIFNDDLKMFDWFLDGRTSILEDAGHLLIIIRHLGIIKPGTRQPYNVL